MTKRKYFREKLGMVFRIDLREGTHGYGQVATETKYIFFDHQDPYDHPTPVEEILEKPVAFYSVVDRYVLKEGLWDILGVWPVKPENQIFPDPFGYNDWTKSYFIWKTGVGQVPCTLEETYGREILASYGHGAIEQRLRDHLARRPNYWVERSRSDHLYPTSREFAVTYPRMKEFYAQYGYNFHWLDEEDEAERIAEEAKKKKAEEAAQAKEEKKKASKKKV
jgi:hypothetical protein